jgi:hypothetical protein
MVSRLSMTLYTTKASLKKLLSPADLCLAARIPAERSELPGHLFILSFLFFYVILAKDSSSRGSLT